MCNSIYTAKVIILLLFYFLHTLLPSTTYKSNVYVSWIKSFFSHDSYLTTSIVHLYVHTSSKPKLIYCQLSLSIEFLHELTSSSIDFLHISTWITFIFSSLYSDFQNFLSCFNYKRFLASNRYFDLLNAKVSQVQLLLFLTNQIWDRPKKIYITFINKLDHI